MMSCCSWRMPMPESCTASAMPPPASGDASKRTSPVSVNLSALDSRFFKICSTRWRSVSRAAGVPGAICTSNMSFFCRASGSKLVLRVSAKAASVTCSGTSSSLPASTLEMSRMSLIRLSRSLPAEWIARANRTCSSVRLPFGFSDSSRARISELFNGVRNSCDILAKNSDL